MQEQSLQHSEDGVKFERRYTEQDDGTWLPDRAPTESAKEVKPIELKYPSTPGVLDKGGGYLFSWKEYPIAVEVGHIKETQRDGKVDGQLTITASEYGGDPTDTGADACYPILQTRFNLTSSEGRKKLATDLTKRHTSGGINWQGVLDQVCYETLQLLKQAATVVVINPGDTVTPITPPQFLIAPIIYKGQPNTIFGPKGCTKSYLALYLALLTQYQGATSELGFAAQKANVLIIDHETDEDVVRYRLHMIANGLGVDDKNCQIVYTRLFRPLTDEFDHIASLIKQFEIDFVVLDSLAYAAGENSNESQAAIAFFSTLRKLGSGITWLIIAHVAKGVGGRRSIFGSVFFTNASRNIFEVEKVQEPMEHTVLVALEHRDSNDGKLLKTIGYKVTFSEDSATFTKHDIRTTPEFSSKIPASVRIKALLEAEGKMKPKEMAEELDLSLNTVNGTLRRGKDKDFKRVGDGYWGSLAQEEELPF